MGSAWVLASNPGRRVQAGCRGGQWGREKPECSVARLWDRNPSFAPHRLSNVRPVLQLPSTCSSGDGGHGATGVNGECLGGPCCPPRSSAPHGSKPCAPLPSRTTRQRPTDILLHLSSGVSPHAQPAHASGWAWGTEGWAPSRVNKAEAATSQRSCSQGLCQGAPLPPDPEMGRPQLLPPRVLQPEQSQPPPARLPPPSQTPSAPSLGGLLACSTPKALPPAPGLLLELHLPGQPSAAGLLGLGKWSAHAEMVCACLRKKWQGCAFQEQTSEK